MKNAVIIHGRPSKEDYYNPQEPSPSNDHWLPWLQAQLIKHDIITATPEMPRAYEPDYAQWSAEFERCNITDQTILVGHSTGGGFLVKWLSLHPNVKVGKVVLVAPWLGLETDGTVSAFFADLKIDPYLALRTRGFYIFNSTDDDASIQTAVQQIREQVPSLDYREFTGKGHFTRTDLQSTEFPELLEELLAP